MVFNGFFTEPVIVKRELRTTQTLDNNKQALRFIVMLIALEVATDAINRDSLQLKDRLW